MTDITELAQSLKAAAEKATQGNWRAFQYHDGRCGIGGGHHDEIMVCEHISKERPHDAMFIALVNPANVITLVEALEKAQQQIIALQQRHEIDPRTHEIIDLKERIAELESRAVKLPKKNIGWDRDEEDCWNNAIDACAEVLAAAGIKVETE
ncbi:ead/Ea22-like family protein [Klebsiella pneumoniae]